MKVGFHRGLVATAALTAALASVPSLALAQIPPSRIQGRVDAWKQVQPLLHERSRPNAGGFDFEPSFELQRGSGYKVLVAEVGGAIAVEVGRGKGAVTAYLARGTATSRRLKGSFGRFGEIDMRFHPSAKLPPRQRGCNRHRRFGRRLGTWTGGFRFIGEADYVSIDVHRAAGAIRRRPPTCSGLPVRVHHGPRAATSRGPFSSFSLRQSFGAGWHHELESAQLFGFQSAGRTLYIASTQQSLGRVGVLRVAVTAGGTGSFTVNSALTHAEVSPPPPFHGTGIYAAASDGDKSWLGDLTVNFPGTHGFPLTGEQFDVEVQRPL